MRLLIVTPEYPPHSGGGILRYYHAMAPALARLSVDVSVRVAAPTTEDFADYEQDGVRVACVSRARSETRVGTEFLDQVNVRDLSRYLGRRLRTGVVSRVGGRRPA